MKDELNDDERREKISELGIKLVNCISEADDGSVSVEIIFSSVLRLLCGVAVTIVSTSSDAQKLKALRIAVLKTVERRLLEAFKDADREASLN